MTREEAKKLLPIIKEYSNGKTVEWFNNVTGKWEELKEPAFDWAASMYRIKPVPKYRPFKSQEEFGYKKNNC